MSNNDTIPVQENETEPNENKACEKELNTTNSSRKPIERISLYEKNRRAVYATGNKWAIENFHATHD